MSIEAFFYDLAREVTSISVKSKTKGTYLGNLPSKNSAYLSSGAAPVTRWLKGNTSAAEALNCLTRFGIFPPGIDPKNKKGKLIKKKTLKQ